MPSDNRDTSFASFPQSVADCLWLPPTDAQKAVPLENIPLAWEKAVKALASCGRGNLKPEIALQTILDLDRKHRLDRSIADRPKAEWRVFIHRLLENDLKPLDLSSSLHESLYCIKTARWALGQPLPEMTAPAEASNAQSDLSPQQVYEIQKKNSIDSAWDRVERILEGGSRPHHLALNPRPALFLTGSPYAWKKFLGETFDRLHAPKDLSQVTLETEVKTLRQIFMANTFAISALERFSLFSKDKAVEKAWDIINEHFQSAGLEAEPLVQASPEAWKTFLGEKWEYLQGRKQGAELV